ncbi:YheC/YheD family endospore coat-associated protein [Gorillibacterium sp. sgz5001074]|uniref:YheC/YheD family endospore coat-associated protein n=1 Tax=Gorillibacterium sp. sgz5001074 TaxID=3446695 RepID=UPI003F66CE89
MDIFLHEIPPVPQSFIAILTMDDDERPFRGNHRNFIDLIHAGREQGATVYVTRVKDLKLGQKKINGFLYQTETRTWSQTMVPFPQVVYNRIPNRKDEQSPEVQQVIKACMKHSKLKMFNPSFFYKWTLFEWLNKSKVTKKYVPATKKLAHAEELEQMLAQYPSVYLKPVKGKAGSGIMRVERPKSKGAPYILRVQAQKKSRVTHHATVAKLWSSIKPLIGSEEYIVQQGITLASFENRPYDLRVLVQKNSKGEWDLTGVGARVAGKLSITTHVPRGGSINEPEKVLTAAFGSEAAKRTLQRIKRASLSIARQIEKASGHTLGEMSMDLGVDTSGQIWFFEANSRPMKFDEPDIRKKSLDRIIEYSIYLSKKRKKSR